MSIWTYFLVFIGIGIPCTLIYNRLLKESGQAKPIWTPQLVGIWITHKRLHPSSHIRAWFLWLTIIETAWMLLAAGFVR
jgi:hypothetical protein